MNSSTTHSLQRLLGIDYGSKRIGLALTNETGDFALPHSVVENSKDIVGVILKICKENSVSKVVVGESKDFKQKDNKIMEQIKSFTNHLIDLGVEVVLQPEFLTSFQAERTNYELHGKKDMLDASAATIILQSYIDSQK